MFVADERGTTYTSATTRTTMTWDRYRSVRQVGSVVVLGLDNNIFHVLPDVALNPGSSPGEAVAALSWWISSAAAARASAPR